MDSFRFSYPGARIAVNSGEDVVNACQRADGASEGAVDGASGGAVDGV